MNDLDAKLEQLATSVPLDHLDRHLILILLRAAALLGATTEREECAQLCDPEPEYSESDKAHSVLLARWIRVRGNL